ncbi:hypothetical protein F5I97DRAFT_1929223 [Phlebopus sp. FC_14]|nr:hypothetical protein F5I97DRAFT_1929223 [Phlebopus sp. FC_14]
MERDIEDYMRIFSDHRLNFTHAQDDEEPVMLAHPPDTRRFGAIFHSHIPDGVSADCGDSDEEDDADDEEDLSQWEFRATLADTDNTTVSASTCGTAEGSCISAAQQIAARYRAAHTSSPPPQDEDDADVREKALPRIPDDQRSMYTLATMGDAQSTMDLMWRPKPKIQMRKRDKQELADAQSQAMEMMAAAGLSPTDKVQCRRHGCADILHDVNALKYHLHIHNIGDELDGTTHEEVPTITSQVHEPVRKRSLGLSIAVPCCANSQSNTKPSHARSKSAFDARKNSGSKNSQPSIPRKSSTGYCRPHDRQVFSPLAVEDNISMHAPSLTAVAATVVAIPPRTKSPAPHTHSPIAVPSRPGTPSRGRRARKDTLPSRGRSPIVLGREVGYNASIAMLLSPPSSPGSRTVLASQTNFSVHHHNGGHMGTDKELGSQRPVITVERAASPAQTGWRAMSPDRFNARTISPARAISPIRDGLRRVLSIGCMNDFRDN